MTERKSRTLKLRTRQLLLSKLLRDARLKAGITQEQLADRLGVPQSLISKVESGERGLNVFELRDMVRALGFDFPDFVATLDERLDASEG